MSALLAASTAAVPTSAHPPNSTAHGVPAETFHTLWAGDRDGATDGANLSRGSALGQLGNGTDIPLDSPPRAVEQWNSGDHQEFPATSSAVSIHPPDAELTSERFITDAYAEIFAVQPSTRARIAPSRQPFYVAPNGTLRGTVDSRVTLPANDTEGDRRVFWRLERHQIEATTLLVDGEVETTGEGSHTPALSYTLDAPAGETQQVTLQATISTRVRKRVKTCTDHDHAGDCTDWQTSVEHLRETVTVSDTRTVTIYDLQVVGFSARYPNGDLGLVIYKNQPWLGYEVPNGDVRGVWRFYSARDTDWDTLVYRSDAGRRTTHSPLHPLQVNAYPIETGPTPSPRRNVSILDVYGLATEPPTLPEPVNLDVLTESYTASYGIATRSVKTDPNPTVRVLGLVRGVETNRTVGGLLQRQIHRSNLTLRVVNQTAETVTVQARLQDAETGTPITTATRDGYIVVADQRLNTTANGTVTAMIEQPAGGVSARYEPGQWWRTHPAYTGDSAAVLLGGSVLHVLSTLFRLGVPIALFLLAVFLVDRVTGWRVWPPWRRTQ